MNDVKEQFVTYDIALSMKELGFDKPCFGFYYITNKKFSKTNFSNSNIVKTNDYIIDAPIWQQCVDWFIEEHNIYVWVSSTLWLNSYSVNYNLNNDIIKDNVLYADYYKAREQAILKAIEIVNENMAK